MMTYIGRTVFYNNESYIVIDTDTINQLARISQPDTNGLVIDSEWVSFKDLYHK